MHARSRLLERFRASSTAVAEGSEPPRAAVLVASMGFWEGVDLPGDVLQLLVIDKLPFPPPDDPVMEARSRQLSGRGLDPFVHGLLSEAEQALNDQLVFQHSLINAMPDPVFVRDLQGRLLLCNKGYEEYLSVRLERAQGKCLPDMDVLPDATARLLHEEMMEQLSSGKTRFGERQLMLKDGVRFIYQWTVPFYSASGELRGVVGGWTEPRCRSSGTGD